jgi:hypothetical protein
LKKRIPIGIDDFDNLIRENYYFADKSLFIKSVMEAEDAKIILLPRPRRFGKSLNMSMMKYFLTNKNAEKNRELFKGLLIEKESTMEKQGKYPVVYISLKDVKTLDWNNCYNKMINIIKDLYDEFDYLLKSGNFNKKQRIDFEKIWLGEGSQSDYEKSLKFLCEMLYKYHGVKPIVLIDEYDQPIISAYTNGYFEKGINFFRNLFSEVLKNNIALEKAVLTGILRVAKESIFSGLNNLKIDSILKNKFSYFGLTEGEVKEMIHHYDMDYELEEVKEWYNGYVFGKELVYNPWSIINFIDSNELKPHWVNTSSNDLIRESLSNISRKDYNKLVELAEGRAINVVIEENISMDMLDNPEVIWNLMFFSGYLTLTNNQGLTFPNREVRDFYVSQFKRLAGNNINSFNELLEYLKERDMKNFKGLLEEMFLTAVSYYDLKKQEQYYHNLILGFVYGLKDVYEIKSNREYGTGRVDLLLKSKDGKLPNYIFEFKVSKKREDLETDCQKALAQIEENRYGIELENPVKIGMSFFGKELEILVKE